MSTWHRLHPLSPAVRAGRALIAIAVIFLPTLVSGGTNSWDVAWHFIAVGALVVLGVVSWLVTRWQIDGHDLRIETGLLRRSSLRYPLSQVQAIDTVRPGLARALGLAELRLRMGGTGGAARLAYLPVVQANALRARLLALSQGAHEETPEPIDHELVRVPPGRVAVSLLLSGPAVVLVVYLAALAAASSAGKHGLVAVTLPILIADAIAIWRRFNRSFHATVAEAPEGLRVRSGLVETTAETIPRGRVQAVLPDRAVPVASVRLVPARGRRCGSRSGSLRCRAGQAAVAHAPAGGDAGRGRAAARAARARCAGARRQAAAPCAVEIAASLSAAVVRLRRALRSDDRRAACKNSVVGAADEGSEPAQGRRPHAAPASAWRPSTSTRRARTSAPRFAISTNATPRRPSPVLPISHAWHGAREPLLRHGEVVRPLPGRVPAGADRTPCGCGRARRHRTAARSRYGHGPAGRGSGAVCCGRS